MKIEQGKKYLTRDGRVATIIHVNTNFEYVVGTFDGDGKHSWDLNGGFGKHYPDMDLVSEAKEGVQNEG